MSTSTLSYHQFVQTTQASGSFECMERMAYISQMRRKGSNASIYSQNSTLSIYSTTSAKSVIPSATDLNSALYQKGFELRKYDSDGEFDLILEKGFHGSIGEYIPTLKLTLTPDLLRR